MAAVVERPRPEIVPAPSPQPGRLAEGSVYFISKSNTARKARTVTPDGRLPGKYGKIEPGAKKTVPSTAAVERDLEREIVVEERVIVAGNGANSAQVWAEDPRRRNRPILETPLGNDSDGDTIKNTLTAAGVEVIDRRYDNGDTPSALDIEIKTDTGADDRIIFSGSPDIMPQVSRENLPKKKPGYIYLTSVGGENWDQTYTEITTYSDAYNIPRAVSPGTKQIEALNDISARGEQKRKALYDAIDGSSILFLNAKEGEALVNSTIVSKIDPKPIVNLEPEMEPHRSKIELLLKLKQLGANMISMTDGDNGSYLLDETGAVIHLPVLQADKIVDRSGAGDTYAGGFLKSYLEGLSLEECMRRGAIYANAAIQVEGVPHGFLGKKSIEDRSDETLGILSPRVVFHKFEYDLAA